MKMTNMEKADALIMATQLVKGRTYRIEYTEKDGQKIKKVQQDFYWDGEGYMSKTTYTTSIKSCGQDTHREELNAISGLCELVDELCFQSTEDDWNENETFSAKIL